MASYPPQVVIVDPRFCVPNQVDLKIVLKFKDRMNITNRKFVIEDVNGNLLFKVKERMGRISGTKTLLDESGSPILTLKLKRMIFKRMWYVFKGASVEQHDLLYTVKITGIFQLDVFLAHNKEKTRCDFRVKASVIDRSCVIYAGESDTIVAKMDQRHTFMSFFAGRDKLSVKVFPNVDYAFIASLVVILDDILWTAFDMFRFTKRIYLAFHGDIFQLSDVETWIDLLPFLEELFNFLI